MINLENTYAQLPQEFFQKTSPTQVKEPKLIAFNQKLAQELELNLNHLNQKEIAELFSGNQLPIDWTPLAMTYAGHQFGHFVPQLGDGRAILLGEIVDSNKQRFDIQLKGAGLTAFSRNGDGRAALGPVLREYVVSEAMKALGVATTRSLAIITTGEHVYREQSLPGAILTRIAASHLRIGTFEYFASRGDIENLKILADYSIGRHYPEVCSANNPYLEFFKAIAKKKLKLVAQWMSLGFIHGVMNTDNTTISGETIDYGPCAFIDHFSFKKVFSSIDRYGRYAYHNQSQIAIWNLSCLANCLIPLIADNEKKSIKLLKDEIDSFENAFDQQWVRVMSAKLGLRKTTLEDKALINEYLQKLQEKKRDFTNSFRNLTSELETESPWHLKWHERRAKEKKSIDEVIQLMNTSNPVYIPRNHQIEKAIDRAVQGDNSHFLYLLEVLKKPYHQQPGAEELSHPPREHEIVQQTFCGT